MDSISVIIVNWNGRNLISDCLESLRRQSYPDFTTIIVDNGSNDGSVDFIERSYPEVSIIALPVNMGFSKANNVALQTVKTEYVALMNNDAVADRLWLESLLTSLKKHPSAGFAASKMLFYNDPERIDRAGDSYTNAGVGLLRGRGELKAGYTEEEAIFGACAGAALYRTRMLEEIGLFDEDFFLLYEDVDLSFRAQLKGYRCLYVPKAIVYHKTSRTLGYDSSVSVYYSHRNLEWVYIQNMPATLMLKTIWLHVIYDLAALVYFTANGQIKYFLKAKWDALKGLNRSLKKRWQVQGSRRVDDRVIWGLLEKELFLPRLTRRLKKI